MIEILKNDKYRFLISEGIEDPSILKCIFLAGGPGSGKSYIANDLFNIPSDLPLSSYGLKVINNDFDFELLLKQQNISSDLSKLSPDDFNKLTSGPDSLRNRAKRLTSKKLSLYRNSKLGLIIDGTGDSIESIQQKKKVMESFGYDCFMIFVNTSFEVALERNNQRNRKLPEKLVKDIWNKCQLNIGHYQNLFGNNFRIIDNSKPEKLDKSVIRSVIEFLKSPVKNHIGKNWIKTYYKQIHHIEHLPDNDDYKDFFNYDDDSYKTKEPMRPRSW
jgi:predicted kinase